HLLQGVFFTWPPRPFRELVITEEVRRRGIPTAEVLAACIRRISGPFYRGWLVARQLKGGQDLWTALRDGFVRQTGAEKVFAEVRSTLHVLPGEVIFHRDLNLKNIVVGGEYDGVRVYIIDFDRATLFLGEVPMIMARRTLARFPRSANKLAPNREYFSAN